MFVWLGGCLRDSNTSWFRIRVFAWGAQAKGIEVLPIVTNVDGNDYRDGIDLGRDEFFELLEETGLFPTTSQITPHTFAEKFKEARDAGDEVIALILSSALSGTYQNACTARAMVGNEVFM